MRSRPLVAITRCLAFLWLSIFFKIEVLGLGNIPEKGAVIAAKHRRWEDIPLLALALPIDLYYLAKVELFLGPLKRRIMDSLGGISINRLRPIESRASLRRLGEILAMGKSVVVFPEGTYFRHSMGQGRQGALRFTVSRFGCPVVPVGVEYLKGFMRTRVVVRVGRPVDETLAFEELQAKVMAQIAELSGF